ncbi:MAG: HRDC domain-containing protein, partial [Polyangiaceae bacterium]|nr:HRDC domain-containing protein [Polyangiaceae bacterium]
PKRAVESRGAATARDPSAAQLAGHDDREAKPDELDEKDRRLFEALRAHRAELAKKSGVPPYVIAHDRTLRDIARIRPISIDDLDLARGMGPAKIAKYGEGLLAVVRGLAGR